MHRFDKILYNTRIYVTLQVFRNSTLYNIHYVARGCDHFIFFQRHYVNSTRALIKGGGRVYDLMTRSRL